MDHQDSQGQTPIHYAVRNQKGIEILKLFNKHSPECPKEAINIQDENGQSALHLAAKDSMSNSTTHLELVKVLIANGAMTQVKDKNDKLPMDLVPEDNREVTLGYPRAFLLPTPEQNYTSVSDSSMNKAGITLPFQNIK
ncbi:uncharacterized protein LOC143236497 [Tachypleus tridentatus]|uniref:uncharacterized protein LOC143236497 n=1 Tax=Tachypleus tridentatus TaxID=6853 RepID=UPI003FCF1F09